MRIDQYFVRVANFDEELILRGNIVWLSTESQGLICGLHHCM